MNFGGCMAKTAILIGNGIFDSSIKDYRNYVDEFIDFANRNRMDRVIVSGGHTDTNSMHSEASSLNNYMKPRLDKRIKLVTEEKSITASQSIKYIKPILRLKPHDDVTVFCDSAIAVKVMWFVMHYWFSMSKKEIEGDALNFISAHYSRRNGIDDMGKWISVTGVLYKNVEVHPYIIKPSLPSAIAQQLISIIDIASIYNPALYKDFISATKQRYGLKK